MAGILKAGQIVTDDGLNGVKLNTTTGKLNYFTKGWEFEDIGGGVLNPLNKTTAAWANETTNSWTVPSGVNYIFVKMWGAGGGGGARGGWTNGGRGGAGGYSQGLVPVTPGQTITIRPGQRGYSRWGANKAFPDGGGASTGAGDNQYAGSGGGSSSILSPVVSAEYCMFAGGGGGGGSVTGWQVNHGGAGGGINGQPSNIGPYHGTSVTGGGASQTAGGAAGVGANSTGGAGAFKQGGTHQNANCYGGGGGGGWYGGGSGAYGSSTMSGGGGGSGYIHPSILLGVTIMGQGFIPGNPNDPKLSEYQYANRLQFAMGGEEDGYGGPGLIVFYY